MNNILEVLYKHYLAIGDMYEMYESNNYTLEILELQTN
jgi:hypothetical protein